MEERIKQVIVVRKDLNMTKGKLAAQVAHASLGVILSCMDTVKELPGLIIKELTINKEYPLGGWLSGKFTKIVLWCKDEDELLKIENQANKLCIPNYLITDAGDTMFDGVPTRTCIALGPDYESILNKITGELKLA